ncbi:hypothetical protein [Microbacterium sp. SLBN-111]|uniref:hypothetical protein n=1 Tax=Microbacterium sp. SLBN-111 TaxID=3377733 RepID=UPI003C782E16
MIGWHFLLSLLPERHAVGHFNATPAFRQWAPPRTNRIDEEHYWKVTRAVYELCLERVGAEPSLWPGLIEHLDNLPDSYREEAYARLVTDRDRLTEEEQFLAWEALDALARRHREYADARWALPVESRIELESVAGSLRPERASLSERWLFDDSMPDLGIKKASDSDNYEQELARLRGDAVVAIWEEGGLDLLIDVAHRVSTPWSLGYASGVALDLPLEVIAELLDADSETSSEFATAALRATAKGDLGRLGPLVERFGGRPDVQARLLLMAEDLPGAWAIAESTGADVDAKYWAGFYPFGRGANFSLVNETARKLVDHRRWATALDLMSHFITNGNLDEDLIIEAFTSMLHEGDPELRVLSEYEITNLMSYLRESNRVDGGTLARLEWQLLPALDSQPDSSTLQRTLSESPEFFVEVISLLYRRRSERGENSERTTTEVERNLASNAWRLLHEWGRVPGTVDETHTIDFDALVAWAAKARELLKEADRLEVGESQIGQVLAFAPADEDGTWPARAVRDFLEAHGSKKVLSGFSMGTYNKRGVTSRGVTEGGAQEYALADRYTKWADATKIRWPKTSRVLRDLADEYRSEGRRNDEQAQRAQEGFGL